MKNDLAGWIGALGITCKEATTDRFVCKITVGPKTIQPMGLLAFVTLAVLHKTKLLVMWNILKKSG